MAEVVIQSRSHQLMAIVLFRLHSVVEIRACLGHSSTPYDLAHHHHGKAQRDDHGWMDTRLPTREEV
jgi:hypothetical protein